MYIYEKTGNGWIEQQKLNFPEKQYRGPVSLIQDLVIVGGAPDVFVFQKNQGLWSLSFKMETGKLDFTQGDVATNGTDFWAGDYAAYNLKGRVLINSPSCSQNNLSVTIPDALAIPVGGNVNTVYIGYQPASSIILTAVATEGNSPYLYSWLTTPLQTTQQITVSPVTTNAYTCIVTDATGCTASSTKTITVVDIRTPGKPGKVNICHRDLKGKWTTLSVLASSVAEHLAHGDYLGICNNISSNIDVLTRAANETGDHEIISEGFKIYPNPAAHFLDVQWTSANTSQSTLRILNAEGRVVRTVTTKGAVNNQRISLEGLARGIYMLVLKTGSDQKVSKFVIQ